MNMKTTISALMIAIALALVGISGCQNKPASSASGEQAAKLYDIKGTVTALDVEKKVITIDHEDIPGLMKAMKMEFAVDDPKTLTGMKPGDAVQGKLKADGGKYVVTSLEKR